MDKVKKQKSKRRKLTLIVVCVALVISIGAAFASTNLDFSHKRLDRDLLTIGRVQEGPMEEKISATGMLLPRKVEWLSAEVDGQVEEIAVEPGDEVEASQVIVRLSNAQLRTAAEEAESLWRASIAARESIAAELENQDLDQKAITLSAKFRVEKEKLQEEAEAQLIMTKTIPEIQYRKTQLNVSQLGQMYEIEKQRLRHQKRNKAALLAVKEAEIERAKSALDRANRNVEGLTITAGISGIVQELSLEIGQRMQSGSKLGQIASQDTLYAELRVAARQASDISIGQHCTVDTRNGFVSGKVSRVDPAVRNGLVSVDIAIDDELPRGSRPELPVEGIIYLSKIERTLFVTKPIHVRSNSQISVYRLTSGGQYAHRTNVLFGKVSVNHAQIVEGLSAGDHIILSDSSTWQDHERVLISN